MSAAIVPSSHSRKVNMFLQKTRLRRAVATQYAEEAGVRFFAALRLVDKINDNAKPEELSAASGLPAECHKDGLLSEASIYAVCVAAGCAIPVHAVGAIGDGTFLKWLLSDEGLAQLLKAVEKIAQIVAILAALFP